MLIANQKQTTIVNSEHVDWYTICDMGEPNDPIYDLDCFVGSKMITLGRFYSKKSARTALSLLMKKLEREENDRRMLKPSLEGILFVIPDSKREECQ